MNPYVAAQKPPKRGRSAVPSSSPIVRPREIPLNWDDLTRSNRLRDGDVIETAVEVTGDESKVVIVLRLADYKDWWKGVEVCADDDSRIALLEVEKNGRGPVSVAVDVVNIRTGGRLYFWKAKAFGVHTRMYLLPGLASQAGKQITFTWVAD